MTQLDPRSPLAAALAALLVAAPSFAQGRDAAPPIAGRVLDARGQPAPDTFVYLVRRMHPELPADLDGCLGDDPYHIEIAATDARGRFRIEPDGYWPMAMYARRGNDAYAPMRFPVLPGDFIQLELQPAAKVRGLVLHAGNRERPAQDQIVEVRVNAEFAKQNALWGFDVARLLPFVRFHARTDADGQFELAVPGGSRVRVGVHSAETLLWSDDPTEIALPPAQPVALNLRSVGRPVAAARAHDLSLPARARPANDRGTARLPNLGTSPILIVAQRHQPVLLAPSDLDDPVTLKQGERLRGRLVQRDGAPLAGARLVFARPFSQGPREMRWRFAAWTERCDDDGRFDFGWLERGVPLVGYAEVDGHFTCFVWRVPGGPLDLGEVTVTSGYQLRGNISAPDRTPAAGAWVFFRPALPSGDVEIDNPAVQLALSQLMMTGRGGGFRVGGLMPGSYDLIVRQRGCRVTAATVVAQTDPDSTRLELTPAAVVRGIVVDGAGKPIPGISVTLMQDVKQFIKAAQRFGDPPVHLTTRTATDGSFEFTDLPADLVFDLRAFGNHAGGIRHARLIDVPLDGERVQLELR